MACWQLCLLPASRFRATFEHGFDMRHGPDLSTHWSPALTWEPVASRIMIASQDKAKSCTGIGPTIFPPPCDTLNFINALSKNSCHGLRIPQACTGGGCSRLKSLALLISDWQSVPSDFQTLELRGSWNSKVEDFGV